jgi:nucleoside 2-deoxyribosyltransferase
LGVAIADANEVMMRTADIIIANVQPWRGPEADDGTSYEIGFMAALQKLVVLHTNDGRSFAQRIIDDIYHGEVYQDGAVRRGTIDHMMIEEFSGFVDNLMLINAAAKSFERATGKKADPATLVKLSFEDAANFAYTLWSEQTGQQ